MIYGIIAIIILAVAIVVGVNYNNLVKLRQRTKNAWSQIDVQLQKRYEELRALREQGILIFGTGNIVHNLRMVDWNKAGEGFDWAYEFDEYIYDNILNKKHENILKFYEQGNIARLAVPTPDHFYPLLYVLGASDEDDKISAYNKSCELGSLTMTAYLWE